jgi:hypothetical protein
MAKIFIPEFSVQTQSSATPIASNNSAASSTEAGSSILIEPVAEKIANFSTLLQMPILLELPDKMRKQLTGELR